MGVTVVDEYELLELPLKERLERLNEIFKNHPDESARWDATWLTGEIAEEAGPKDPIYNDVADLLAWALKHDSNSIVRHEVCYQIAGRNMRSKIPNLVEAALHDESSLVRHEATECLGIMHAFEARKQIEKNLNDPNKYVRDTAIFVLKRMDRTKGREFDPDTKSF